MRICVVSTPIFRFGLTGTLGYSGLEHLAWQQAAGLARKGHEVYLIAPDGSVCPGVTVVPVGVERTVDERMAYGGYPEHKEGDRVLRRAHAGYWQVLQQVDCVICHDWNKWAYMLKAEGALKAPVLGVTHAPVNTMWTSLPPVEKPCIVCISEDQASHFKALFEKDCRVCHNGVNTSFYKPTGVKRTDRFLFLARFSSVKSPDLCLEACIKAGVPLDMVGDTTITGEPQLVEKCKKMADGKHIRIVGPATRGECVHWFSQAHAMLHLTPNFREPFGLAPVEAMACGCPVIAWDRGAMRETISPEVGWLVNSFEDIVHAIKSERDATPVAGRREYCRQWVIENFSVEKMVDRMESLCHEAIQTGGW